MISMQHVVSACVCALTAAVASAGALDECMIRGDQTAVTRCLVEADNDAQAAMNKAEGSAGKLARRSAA